MLRCGEVNEVRWLASGKRGCAPPRRVTCLFISIKSRFLASAASLRCISGICRWLRNRRLVGDLAPNVGCHIMYDGAEEMRRRNGGGACRTLCSDLVCIIATHRTGRLHCTGQSRWTTCECDGAVGLIGANADHSYAVAS